MPLGPLMMDIQGLELSPQEREKLLHPLVGGVILFRRNHRDKAQLKALVSSIHALRSPPLLVAVDQEGGRVQRLREGFTPLPSPRTLGRYYDKDRARGRRFAFLAGWLMAAELRALGIDLSLAPVLDIDRGESAVIGDRAFHHRPIAVADLATAFVKGMRRAGMASVGKHFPGHGGVAADSHLETPLDERRFADIFMEDMLPFERLIHQGIEAIMPAHVIYACLSERPAGFSRRWIADVLRGRLGFQGAVLSDDLGMAGAATEGGFAERARAALAAGCDMVILCHHPQGVDDILEGLGGTPNPVSALRLSRLHGRRPSLSLWKEAKEALNALTR